MYLSFRMKREISFIITRNNARFLPLVEMTIIISYGNVSAAALRKNQISPLIDFRENVCKIL